MIMTNESYPNIDMEKTGCLLKRRIQQAGYTVKDIQEKLLLSCPQPIYRWYKGKVLPSVNHLYVLSDLLNVHMEELLVPRVVYSVTFEASRFSARNNLLINMMQNTVYIERFGIPFKIGESPLQADFCENEKRLETFMKTMKSV